MRIFAGVVRIRTPHAERGEIRIGSAAKTAVVELIGPKRVLHPGRTDLFEAIVIVRPAAHSIEILRNDGMVCVRQLIKVHRLISVVARSRGDPQADLGSGTSSLDHAGQISHHDIGSMHKSRSVRAAAAARGHYRGFGCAVNDCADLDRINDRGDRNFPGHRSRVCRATQLVRELF